MSVINTNIAGKIATNAILKNDRMQEIAMERLSTGLRINSAKDDAAGLAITQRMKAEVSGLEMATRNANDGISMLETAEGASLEIANMLQRMRELSVQSATGTYSDTDRKALDLEFGELMNEIVRIAENTTWNTMTIMNGKGTGLDGAIKTSDIEKTDLKIQLGKSTDQKMDLVLKSWHPANTVMVTHINERLAGDGYVADAYAAGTANGHNDHYIGAGATFGDAALVANQSYSAFGSAVLWTGGDDGAEGGADNANRALAQNADKRISISTETNAGFALTQLDKAITAVSSERAMYGAYISRLQHAGDNLLNVAQNQDQSRSRIEDADYAIESSELSRTQIIGQASTAMLAQANQVKATVLQLLQ
jgi:flagellin